MGVLFRMSTGESWNGIYHDCTISEADSLCSRAEGNCGDPLLATVFFFSFYFFSALVMLNVFVAVVLKNFEDQIAASSKTLTIPLHAMDDYEKLWAKFCEQDGEFMRASRLGTFLNLLVEPLGLLSTPKFGKHLERFIFKLDVPQSSGLVHYIDLGTTLTLVVFGHGTSHIPEENEFMKHLRAEMFRKYPKFKVFKKAQTSTMSFYSFRASTMRSNVDHELDPEDKQREELEDEDEHEHPHREEGVKTNAFEWRVQHYLSQTQRDEVFDLMMAETRKFEDEIGSEDLEFGNFNDIDEESTPSTEQTNKAEIARQQKMIAVQEIKSTQNLADCV